MGGKPRIKGRKPYQIIIVPKADDKLSEAFAQVIEARGVRWLCEEGDKQFLDFVRKEK